MQTRNILGVRSIVVVASLVALVSLAVWSVGFGLSSTQSLQNQVTSLQSQVASLNEQLAEKQEEIKNLNSLVTGYRNLLERLYPELETQLARARVT